MRSILTLLFAALLVPESPATLSSSDADVEVMPASAFCAELQQPPVLTIADGDEDYGVPFDEEQGCSESDGRGPYDIEADVDGA